ncbi:hypothetical protein Tco_0232573, partial [Tanacetum coccineum]
GLESVRYGVSKVLDTAYQGFLGVGTTFDIFQNILFPYSLNTAYCLLLDTAYWILFPSWSLVRSRGSDFDIPVVFSLIIALLRNKKVDDPDITMDEYVQYQIEKSIRNGQMYNWKTAKYGKINFIGDVNYLRFFETKFPAIVYDDGLSSLHVDEVNWKNKTSLSEYDDGKYNVISDKDLFSYDIFSVNDLKSY